MKKLLKEQVANGAASWSIMGCAFASVSIGYFSETKFDAAVCAAVAVTLAVLSFVVRIDEVSE